MGIKADDWVMVFPPLVCPPKHRNAVTQGCTHHTTNIPHLVRGTATEHGPFKWMGLATTTLQQCAMHTVVARWISILRGKAGSEEATYHLFTDCQMHPDLVIVVFMGLLCFSIFIPNLLKLPTASGYGSSGQLQGLVWSYDRRGDIFAPCKLRDLVFCVM